MKYDYFFSTPISELSLEDKKSLSNILRIFQNHKTFIELLNSNDIKKPSQYFLNKDLEAIDNSKELIVIIPSKACSSLLIEVGYAIAKHKKITFFVRDKKFLPFLLRDEEVYLFNSYEDLFEMLFENIKQDFYVNKEEAKKHYQAIQNHLNEISLKENFDFSIEEKPSIFNKIINTMKLL